MEYLDSRISIVNPFNGWLSAYQLLGMTGREISPSTLFIYSAKFLLRGLFEVGKIVLSAHPGETYTQSSVATVSTEPRLKFRSSQGLAKFSSLKLDRFNLKFCSSGLPFHCCGQNILHVTQMGCKTTNFTCFHGNTANKGFCSVQIDLQNAVIIFVLCFATLQNKLATAVAENPEI